MNTSTEDIRKAALYRGAVTEGSKIDDTRARYMPLRPFFEQQLKERKRLVQIAQELNAQGINTPHAKKWYATTVSRVLKVLGLQAVGRWG